MHDMISCPRLPVFGWSAYSGARDAHLPGVLSAPFRRYTVSGRAAISLALNVLQLKPGDEALVPTYHCPTMISPVAHAGLQPLFYPITESGAPDLNWIAQADLKGVRVMLATHYFGLPQPMSAVRQFCDAHGIKLIEDCAHAFFGVSENRPVGSWGDIAIASLTKFFPVPEGGLIVSTMHPLDDLSLTSRTWHDEIKAAADAIEIGVRHGRFPGVNAALGGVFRLKDWVRGHDTSATIGANGDSQDENPALKRLLYSVRPTRVVRWITDSVHRSRIVALRRSNYMELARRFSDMRGGHVLRPVLPENAAPYVFPLYVNDPVASYQPLRASGVPIFRWDEIWPGTPALEGDHGVEWSTHVFQLGCHQDLSLDDLGTIATTVRGIVRP